MNESVDGQSLKAAFVAGAAMVAREAERINAMNVFPVPDGDTGANMTHTLRRACEEIAQTDSAHAGEIAAGFAQGALMGARGNSGTILSQLLRGFADGLRDSAVLTPALLVDAANCAVERAYAAVAEPTEGTILTVARRAAEAISAANTAGISTGELLDVAVHAASEALADTPNLLPILREAGVVDAGGMGLLCFLQGMQQGANSEIDMDFATVPAQPTKTATRAEDYGYDVQFLMRGANLDADAVRGDMMKLGWSVLVAGDESALKVHLHAHNPAPPLDCAIKSGAQLDDIVVENMTLQARAFQLPQAQGETAVIAVADGAGFQAIFRDLGCARVLDSSGGKPSTQDFVAAINSLTHERIIILPNDADSIMAAEQAAQLAGKSARVAPLRSMQQGISAMIAYGGIRDAEPDLEFDVEYMSAALDVVVSIAIAPASRSAHLEGVSVREGDFIAIVDGRILAANASIEGALLDALDCPDMADCELATLFYGADMTEDEAKVLRTSLQADGGELEYELVFGGQQLYPILASVE